MKGLRVIAIVLFAVGVAACGPAPAPTPIPVPSHPAAGGDRGPGLLVRLDVAQEGTPGFGRHVVDYLADGTVIAWSGNSDSCRLGAACGHLERNTLTPQGLAALQALLTQDLGLLSGPATHEAQALPGKTLSARSATVDTLVLPKPNGDRYAVVVTDTESLDPGTWVADPAITELNTLVRALINPGTTAGPDGLLHSTWSNYQPSQVAVFVSFSEVDPQFAAEGLAPDLATLGWPFEGAPDTFGETFTGTTGTSGRCAFLSSSDATKALTGLSSVGGGLVQNQVMAGTTWYSSAILWSAKSPTTALTLGALALLPEDAAVSCADALNY